MENTNVDKITFEELCFYGAKYINNEVKDFFGIWHHNDDNMYELTDDKFWIRNIIYQYNKNGFFTTISQPGDDGKCTMFKSIGSRIENNINDVKKGNFGIQQRAMISGFMKRTNCMKVYDKLKKDDRIVIYSEINNENLLEEYTYCSISYEQINETNKRIMYDEYKKTESWNDYMSKYDFDDVHCTTFGLWPFSDFSHLIKDTEHEDIVSIAFMDKIWNDNTYLWTTLLDTINSN